MSHIDGCVPVRFCLERGDFLLRRGGVLVLPFCMVGAGVCMRRCHCIVLLSYTSSDIVRHLGCHGWFSFLRWGVDLGGGPGYITLMYCAGCGLIVTSVG